MFLLDSFARVRSKRASYTSQSLQWAIAPSLAARATLHVAGIVWSALPAAKAEALTWSLQQATTIVRLDDEEID